MHLAYLRLLFCARMKSQSTIAWTAVSRKETGNHRLRLLHASTHRVVSFMGTYPSHPSNADRPMTSRLTMRSLRCWLSKSLTYPAIAGRSRSRSGTMSRNRTRSLLRRARRGSPANWRAGAGKRICGANSETQGTVSARPLSPGPSLANPFKLDTTTTPAAGLT